VQHKDGDLRLKDLFWGLMIDVVFCRKYIICTTFNENMLRKVTKFHNYMKSLNKSNKLPFASSEHHRGPTLLKRKWRG
jgi:hypothetical protein